MGDDALRDNNGASHVGDNAAEDEVTAQRAAERARDAAEASRDRFAFIAEVSRCLAESLDYDTTLTTVAGMSLPYLGAWCIVDVCTPEAGIRRLAVLHPDPSKQAVARELHERYPPQADDLVGAPPAAVALGWAPTGLIVLNADRPGCIY